MVVNAAGWEQGIWVGGALPILATVGGFWICASGGAAARARSAPCPDFYMHAKTDRMSYGINGIIERQSSYLPT